MNQASAPHLSVVSPVYGCRACLSELSERIAAAIPPNVSYEVILVDDGSPDRPWETIAALGRADPRVRGLRLSRNFGQHAAIMAGLSAARGEWIVVLDCDLQDDPKYIPELLGAARSRDDDVVRVRRVNREGESLKRLMSRAFYAVFSYLLSVKVSPEIGNYGVYRREVIDAVLSCHERKKFFPALIEWVGFRKSTIDVPYLPRHAGKSAYNFRRLLSLAFDTIIGFSDRPLRILVTAGMMVTVLALIASLVVLIRYLFHGIAVQGWTTVVLSVWILGGMNIMLLGLVGSYIGRILDETKARPAFIVAETTPEPVDTP
jgi:polyisoprenyl-phosphate glycosyltransferase